MVFTRSISQAKLLLVIATLMMTTLSFSQERNVTINKENLTKVVNSQLTKILTGNSFSNYGKYISVSTSGKFSFNGLAISANNFIWSYEVSGGATNGIQSIATNGTLNSNVGGKVTMHKVVNIFRDKYRRTTNRIAVIDDLSKSKPLQFSELKTKFLSDTLDLFYGKEVIVINIKLNNLEKLQSKMKQRLIEVRKYANYKADSLRVEIQLRKDKIKSLLDDIKNVVITKDQGMTSIHKIKEEIRKLSMHIKKNKDGLSQKVDSINYAAQRGKFDLEQAKEVKKTLTSLEYKDTKILERIIKFQNDSVTLLKKNDYQIEYTDLTWFSLGYGFKNDAFKLFDETQPADSQIAKESYTSQEVNLGLSRYRFNVPNKNSFLWTLGLTYNHTTNLGDLDTRQILDTKIVSTTPLRESIKKQDVFIGNLEKGISRLNVFLDYFAFLSKENVMALHVNPRTTYADGQKPISSLHFGLLLPFKKSKDQSSLINIEIFYQLNDVFNIAESERSLLARNTIGVQAQFPLNFLTNKN